MKYMGNCNGVIRRGEYCSIKTKKIYFNKLSSYNANAALNISY